MTDEEAFQQWWLAPGEPFADEEESARSAWQAAIKHEREECAKVCDEQQKEPECPERASYCADAIRAR